AGGHAAVRLQGAEIGSPGGLARLGVDLLDVELQPRLVQHDVGRKGTGTGRIVELHGRPPRRGIRALSNVSAALRCARRDLDARRSSLLSAGAGAVVVPGVCRVAERSPLWP